MNKGRVIYIAAYYILIIAVQSNLSYVTFHFKRTLEKDHVSQVVAIIQV